MSSTYLNYPSSTLVSPGQPDIVRRTIDSESVRNMHSMTAMSSSSSSPKFTLYTYFRSSCSARLRIALNLKGIPYVSRTVNLLKDEHLTAEHSAINPSNTVPALVVEFPASKKARGFTITQSLAALEYLEEIDASHPLPPPVSDPEARATVRTLADIIACDVQPVTNLKVLKWVGKPGVHIDREKWARTFIMDGFRAYEAIAASTAGKFSVGDQITLADVCLIPAAWGAERVGVKLSAFPTIERVVKRLEKEDAVKNAHWRAQEDTPVGLR
ncbi:hypothetical protein MPDQ_004772 [Monascus purpureus]|uniref:Maleylacetoacetate isomerase n=1 Tax=Monascus purpureus TaxID=5098 RepID=A0A507R1I4_MONPU|nr:hypothetical protein MPDQ_004772 [Monascus purpureus]